MEENLLEKVFWRVAQAGAITTRKIVKEFGPKPNWQAELDAGYLREVQTIYGPVLRLTEKAWAADEMNPPPREKGHLPRLYGPSSVVNQAYLHDALEVLRARGYTVVRDVRKSSGATKGQVVSGRPKVRPYTDQIVRTVMCVPDERMHYLRRNFPGGQPYAPDRSGRIQEALGYPSLYASISGGGITLPRLRQLYKRHMADITAWRSSLLIAAPSEEPLLPFIRAATANYWRLMERHQPRLLPPEAARYAVIEVIVLPLPKTVSAAR